MDAEQRRLECLKLATALTDEITTAAEVVECARTFDAFLTEKNDIKHSGTIQVGRVDPYPPGSTFTLANTAAAPADLSALRFWHNRMTEQFA